MRYKVAIVAALALAATSVNAQDTATTGGATAGTAVSSVVAQKSGQMLRDGTGARIGRITQVYKDGSVQVIYESHLIMVPAASLSVTDGTLRTSMTRKDLR